MTRPMSRGYMVLANYDDATSAALYDAYDATLDALMLPASLSARTRTDIVGQVTMNLLVAAFAGERDPARLRRAAMAGLTR